MTEPVKNAKTTSRFRIAAILVLAACLLLGGCGVKRMLGIGPPRPAVRDISVIADIDANQGNATQLDIVVVYTAAATAALPKTGPDWFRQRDALRKMLAKDIDVVSLEVPTPSATFEVKLPRKARNKGLAIVAFANYANPEGWPIVALTPFKHPALRLQATSIAATEQ